MIEDTSTRLIPGWFGKIPALGDFASRRLPSEFIEPWDAWLQQSITASQRMLGDNWTEAYLHAPIWRFALMPGVCGQAGWAGILMSSVDKVGRYFPLTVAALIESGREIPGASALAQAWYAGVEQVAMSALNLSAVVDELESALAEHPYPYSGAPPLESLPQAESMIRWWLEPPAGPQTFAYPELTSIGQVMQLSPVATSHRLLSGRSLWWTAPPVAEPAVLHGCVGLPPEDYFAILLQGGRPIPAPAESPPIAAV